VEKNFLKGWGGQTFFFFSFGGGGGAPPPPFVGGSQRTRGFFSKKGPFFPPTKIFCRIEGGFLQPKFPYKNPSSNSQTPNLGKNSPLFLGKLGSPPVPKSPSKNSGGFGLGDINSLPPGIGDLKNPPKIPPSLKNPFRAIGRYLRIPPKP